MTSPRLEIRLDRLHHNATTLIGILSERGISTSGVTKATLGSPEIARELVRAGASSLAESRIDNIERLRSAGLTCDIHMIRSPMLSQVDRVVAHANVSFVSEIGIADGLSAAAVRQQQQHAIVLMVELGDLREGILPADLHRAVGHVLALPFIDLRGLGVNLACQNGIAPDSSKMQELSGLANSIELAHGIHLELISGGNSANLDWALSSEPVGRINQLRLGESILLGREPLHGKQLVGLHTDAFTLVAEVIESGIKPTQPWGQVARGAFGETPPCEDRGPTSRVIVALGRQDTDSAGLIEHNGYEILGSSSDHLIIDARDSRIAVGSEIRFQLNYSALLRAMTSPYVQQDYRTA